MNTHMFFRKSSSYAVRIRAACIALACMLLFGAAPLLAQTFQRAIGGNSNEFSQLHPIEVLSDGGTIMVGTTTSYGQGGRDLYLVRTNSLGVVTWAAAYGTSADEEGFDVLELRDLNGNTTEIIAVGVKTVSGDDDVYMVSVNPTTGIANWGYSYGSGTHDEIGYGISKITNGLAVCGRRTQGTNTSEVLFLTTNAAGLTPKLRTVGQANVDDCGYSIFTEGNNTCVIAGFTMRSNKTDGLLFRIDPVSGVTVLPLLSVGNVNNNDTLYSVAPVGGGYLAVGTMGYQTTMMDIWAIKVASATGTVSWSNTYSPLVSGFNYNNITLGADGREIGSSYALVGSTTSQADAPPTTFTKYALLVRVNPVDGSPIATNPAKVYGASTALGKNTLGHGVREVGFGRYLIGGQENHTTVNNTAAYDMHLIRTTTALASGCNEITPEMSYEVNGSSVNITLTRDSIVVNPPSVGIRAPGFNQRALCSCDFCKPVLGSIVPGEAEIALEVRTDRDGRFTFTVHGSANTVDIHDLSGRLVRILTVEVGNDHPTATWDGTDDRGSRLPAGTYLATVRDENGVTTKTIQIVR